MKKFLVFLVFILSISGVFAQDRTYDYSEIDLLVLEQENLAFTIDSHILITGRVMSKYSNGALRKEEFFQNGKRTGTRKWWYLNGQLGIEENYLNNQKHGVLKHWHNNGSLARLEQYDHGKLISNPEYWDSKGKVLKTPPVY